MKKSLLTTIATAGVATIAIADMVMRHMQREQGYNPNDPTSYTTLTLSTNKVTIITLGKVTGAQIK